MVNQPSHSRCPRCQYPVALGAALCSNCGQTLAAAPSGIAGSAAGASPRTPGLDQPSAASLAGEQHMGATTFYDLPPTAPGSQPQASTPDGPLPALVPVPSGSAAALPGSQSPASFAGDAGSVPPLPGSQPLAKKTTPKPEPMGAPPGKEKSNKSLKIALVVLVILLLLSGGLLTYLLTRAPASSTAALPLRPTLTIRSDYHEGTTPAGATGTPLHASGQQFAAHATITFLLDAQPAPDVPTAQSDASGSVTADLLITASWATGNHILTAKDDDGHTTQTGVTVEIVPQGEANTPGPNGAPADDQTFTLSVTIQRQDVQTGMAFPSINESLTISGQPDPNGGKPCQARDDGQPHQQSGDAGNGVTYQETIIWQCSGSYRGGVLAYTETAISDQYAFSDGSACTATTPYVYQQLQGSFSTATSSMGSYRADAVTLNCTQGIGTAMFDAQQGTWSGTR